MSYMDMTARQIERDAKERRRDDWIADVAGRRFIAVRDAILIGDKEKAVEVAEMLADLLCSNPTDASHFIRLVMFGEIAESGRFVASLIERVMRDDADNEAAKEVEEMENDAKIKLEVTSCAK